MHEILEEINELQIKEMGCVPNMRRASPVGCDEEDHAYAAHMVNKGRPNRQRRGRGGVLDTAVVEDLYNK